MDVFAPVLHALMMFGAGSLLLVGLLDSSFLFLPFGNDLLVLTFAARRPARLALYAVTATIGSVAGSMIIDYLARKGGEKGLNRILPERQIEGVKARVSARAGYAIAISALLPPPFPFTPFVAVAAALQFPRWQMIAVLLSARMLRFSVVGILGSSFGPSILKLAEHPYVRYTLFGLLAICVLGSAWSLYGWVSRSRVPAGA